MNFTNPDFSNLTSMASSMNTISQGYFWPLILIGIFMIAYITMSRYTTIRALLASGFMTFVLSIFLFYSGLIQEIVFYGFFTLFILSLIGSFFFD